MNVLALVAASVSLLSLVAAPAVAAPPVEPENKITIDVMDADVINIIRLIADVSGKNVVVADDVKGKITVKLRNVGCLRVSVAYFALATRPQTRADSPS